MSTLLLPGGFKKQPQYAAKLRGANGLSRYVEQAYFAAGWQLNDLGSAKRSLANTGASISAGREGLAFKTSGNTSSYFSSPSAALTRFSLEAFYTPNGVADQYICGIQEVPNSTVHDRELRIDSSGKFLFYIFSGGARQATSTSSATVNTPVHLLGISDGKNIYLYVNGLLEASMAAADAYAGYASPEFVVGTGRLDANTPIPGSGWLNYAIYYNKALSAAEARGRYDNKFSIFGVPARRLFLATSRNDLAATARIQPNAAGIAAVTQVHALAASDSAQANAGDTTAIVQVQLLAPAASAQAQAVSVMAVTQRNILAGAASAQANLSVKVQAFQGHFLLPAPAMQTNTGGTGEAAPTLPASLSVAGSTQAQAVSATAITQHNILAGAASAQANLSVAMPALQGHSLLPAAAMQANTGGTGEAALTLPVSLSTAGSMQGNAASTAGIGRGLALPASEADQENIALAGAIIQMHLLAIPSWSMQSNAGGAGSMLSTHHLVAANPAQANICGAAAIGGTLLLAVATSRQFNYAAAAAMGGALSNPRWQEPALNEPVSKSRAFPQALRNG